MNILVIGSGGREHALVWKLAQSPLTNNLYCTPGNGGIATETLAANGKTVQCINTGAEDLDGLLVFALEKQPDLTVVGPDNTLALGIVDQFEKNGLKIWGPTKKAAQFESSKAFSQDFMLRHKIPTAKSGIFSNPAEALSFAKSIEGKCAVKADGLALGKGVILTQNMQEAENAINQVMVDKSFGDAGNHVVIQEYLDGMEISLHALCDGHGYLLFESSQDHKRALDGDEGLNTGGMGTYSPAPFLNEQQLQAVRETVLDRWIEGCKKEQIDFKGMLYPGLMLTEAGPKVLEFNARFGDPETQVYLMRLENDLPSLLVASVEGKLDQHTLKWSAQSATCVVMASGGYPESYQKGKIISGIQDAESDSRVKVFHAGTSRNSDGQLITSGGRVLGVTALGDTLEDATQRAYEAVSKIHFEGCYFRRDIAAKAL
ncbi:MAG: phosphoribosylamine--glycine ligase [Verrucomicrobia bacterium]|jgi:phosphoribosylamine---glycine ligase|nr:phosphoribosylamine--glycine ligase [Verrucomicrobiota bacterium]